MVTVVDVVIVTRVMIKNNNKKNKTKPLQSETVVPLEVENPSRRSLYRVREKNSSGSVFISHRSGPTTFFSIQ